MNENQQQKTNKEKKRNGKTRQKYGHLLSLDGLNKFGGANQLTASNATQCR
jgi:hypothetical protein